MSQIDLHDRRRGMPFAAGADANGQRAPIFELSVSKTPQPSVDDGQVVEGWSELESVRSERSLDEPDSVAVTRFGLDEAPLIHKRVSQTVPGSRSLEAFGALRNCATQLLLNRTLFAAGDPGAEDRA